MKDDEDASEDTPRDRILLPSRSAVLEAAVRRSDELKAAADDAADTPADGRDSSLPGTPPALADWQAWYAEESERADQMELLARRALTHGLRECERLREAGRVLVAANTRLFNEASAAAEALGRARLELVEARAEIDRLNKELGKHGGDGQGAGLGNGL